MLDNQLFRSAISFGSHELANNSYRHGCIIKRKETTIEGKTRFGHLGRSNMCTSYVSNYLNCFNDVNSDYLIEHLLKSLVTYNLSQIFIRYYKDINRSEDQMSYSNLQLKLFNVYKKVIEKKCESFENEDQKKTFILLFVQITSSVGFSYSSYNNDKLGIRNLVKRVKDSLVNILSDYTFESNVDYVKFYYSIDTTVSSQQYRRNPGLTDIKTGNSVKIFPNTVLAQRISFFKKDDNYGILSFSFIDRSKMIHHEESKYSFTYTSWFEYIDYILRGNVPKHCFTHFFDRDSFLNPLPENANFIKILIKRLDSNQEVILGDGLQEFSNNFNFTYLKQFKTLKEKTEFFNKVLKEMLDSLKGGNISYLSLEEAKKKVDEYNSIFEQQVEKKEVAILTEEVPANLDELMRFAELMSFEPDDTENNDGEEYSDDEEELSEREIPEVEVNVDLPNASNTQDQLVFAPDGNMIISDLPPVNVIEIREHLNNNIINNTNG
jgi:hypothetical protein